MSDYQLPWAYFPELNQDRLTVIAEELLKILDHTYEQLSTPFDDNYTRGTTTFGRQRQMLIKLCMSKKYDWLELKNSGMDVTFEIGSIPVRFFADDPDEPKKSGFYRRNAVDQLFEPELDVPVIHRFVIEKPQFEGEGAKVHFIGMNVLEETLSKWTYRDDRVVTLHSTDVTPPAPVPIELDPISALVREKDKKQNDN